MATAGSTRQSRWRPNAWALVVAAIIVVGSAGSIIGALFARSYLRNETNNLVTSTASSVSYTLETALQREADLLTDVTEYIASAKSPTNGSVSEWINSLDVPARYPGSLGFDYVEIVPAAKLSSFVAAVRTDPPFGVPIVSGFHVEPAGPRPDYCLTRLVDVELPNNPFAKALVKGAAPFVDPTLDYCATPFGDLLEGATTMGALRVVSLRTIFGEPVPGFPAEPPVLRELANELPFSALITPVLESLPGQRTRTQLTGWVVGLVNQDALLSSVQSSEHVGAISLYFRNPETGSLAVGAVGTARAGDITRELSLTPGTDWRVQIAIAPAHSGTTAFFEESAILLGGLLVTLLVGALVLVLWTSRRRALRTVEERTAELAHQALHDALTGLPNRTLVGERAGEMIRVGRGRAPMAAFLIDLDDFKNVNDGFGHGVGDELLEEVARRLSTVPTGNETVGRLGGDEFVLLADANDIERGVEQLAERLQQAIGEPYDLHGAGGMRLSASIGIAIGSPRNVDELIRDADIALYRAKAIGKGCSVVFKQEMYDAARASLELELELRRAIERREFFVVYQPQIDLSTGRIIGVEALLRWNHPDRGVVGPDDFVQTLERSVLILDVGRFVLEQACQQAKQWRDEGLDLTMSVNVSAHQLFFDALVDHVTEALELTGLPASCLTLEITESTLMEDAMVVTDRIKALRSLGSRIAIDDFGSGYASFSYLRRVPVDVLKIDRSFVADIGTADGELFLDALIHLGQMLGLTIYAEGIERDEQLAYLRDEHCDAAQGFLFAPPLEVDEAAALFRTTALQLRDFEAAVPVRHP